MLYYILPELPGCTELIQLGWYILFNIKNAPAKSWALISVILANISGAVSEKWNVGIISNYQMATKKYIHISNRFNISEIKQTYIHKINKNKYKKLAVIQK